MMLKKQIQNGLLSPFSKKKKLQLNSDKMESTCVSMIMQSIDEVSTVSTTSTEGSFVLDDDMNTSLDLSSRVDKLCLNSSMKKMLDGTHSSSSLSCSLGGDSLRSRQSHRSVESKRRKHVHFDDDRNEVNIVESFVSYSSDIWWSKEEVKQRQIDMSLVLCEYSQKELQHIYEYVRAYHHARQKSTISKHPNSDSVADVRSKVNVSNHDFKLIVQGKANGWDGLEGLLVCYVSASTATINLLARRKNIIRNIVDAYDDMVVCSENKDDTTRQLRYIARSLTSCDRSWAVIMGRADHDALVQNP